MATWYMAHGSTCSTYTPHGTVHVYVVHMIHGPHAHLHGLHGSHAHYIHGTQSTCTLHVVTVNLVKLATG